MFDTDPFDQAELSLLWGPGSSCQIRPVPGSPLEIRK